MRESSKAMLRRFSDKKESEFWKTVFSGKGIDVGSGDDLIAVDGVRGFDMGDGDANNLHQYFEAEFTIGVQTLSTGKVTSWIGGPVQQGE